MMMQFGIILKIVECNFIGAHNINPSLDNREQFKLSKIYEAKNFKVSDI